MKHIAPVIGITNQVGSVLAGFLLEKGYEVHGTIRALQWIMERGL